MPSRIIGIEEGSRINLLNDSDDSSRSQEENKNSDKKNKTGGLFGFIKRWISRGKKPVGTLPLEAIHMVGKRAQAYVDLISLGYERWARYLDYDMMDLTTGEISLALDLYVAEVVREDASGNSVLIKKRGEVTPYEFKDFNQIAILELFRTLELNSGRNLYKIVRDLVKFGDAFCLLIPAEEKRGIGEIRVLHPMSVKRIEILETGKTFFFHGPSIRESIDPPSIRKYVPQYSAKNFFENDPMVFETEHDLNEFIEMLERGSDSNYFGQAAKSNPYLNWRVYPNAEDPIINKNSSEAIPHILHFALSPDSFAPYGSSILESVRLKWKQCKAIEDAVIVYRIVRAPERLVIKVDVGDLPPNEADNEIRRVAQSLRKEPIIDSQTGELSYMPMILGITEDIFLGQREGRTISIEPLPSGGNVAEIEDLLYFKKSMLQGLRIPLNYLTYDETETLGILALQDIRMANQVKKIQDWVAKGLEAIIKCHYYFAGREKEIPRFEVSLTPPVSIEENQRLESLSQRIEIGKALAEMGVSSDWIMREIIRLSPEEISEKKRNE